MASVELTISQRETLQALINLFENEDGLIKGAAIAETIDLDPGTIRAQMQTLKSLQLVESVVGPKGGYKPTQTAYDVLDLKHVKNPTRIPIEYHGRTLEEVFVLEICLPSVYHPVNCRAEIHVQGPIDEIRTNESISIGPLPKSNLVIRGNVAIKDTTDNFIILSVDTISTRDDKHVS